MSLKKLNVGCGKRPLEGYDNLDVLDIPAIKYPQTDTREIPVEDNYYDEVSSQWVLEHFNKEDLLKVVTEWKRVVKDGGVIKVVTNNQEAINAGLADKKIDWKEWETLTLGSDTKTLGGCHKSLFKEEDIMELFWAAGFSNIEIRSTTKVRGEGGQLKCPGIIISAIK